MEESQNQNETPATPPEPDDLAKLRAQCDEHLAGWKRAAADYANLQKDMARQRDEMGKYACSNLVSGLLPALDGFRDAAAHAPKPDASGAYDQNAVTKWMQGLEQVRKQLETTLKNAGVQPVDEANVPFDPTHHEAVLMEKPVDPAQSGQVLKVLQSGYRMHDRVLRAAKVVVAE